MITQKELTSLSKLGSKIQTSPEFPKSKYSYKVYLMTPDFDEIQTPYFTKENKKDEKYLYQAISIAGCNIDLFIVKWSEFLDDILTGLNYMSQSLELREKNVSVVLDKEFNNLIQLPKKKMYQKKVSEITALDS